MLRKFTFSPWRSSIYQPLETRHQRLWRGRDFISQFVDPRSHQRYSNQSTRIDKVQRSMHFQIKFFSHRELFKEDLVIVIIDSQTLQKIFLHILILRRSVFFFHFKFHISFSRYYVFNVNACKTNRHPHFPTKRFYHVRFIHVISNFCNYVNQGYETMWNSICLELIN